MIVENTSFEDATYSPEDNKLRLYPITRLDKDLYQRVRDAGFKWAPKQELFVAPMWTPQREDLIIELFGEINLEGTTMAERAEAKADRLQELAHKRADDADRFMQAADRASERFSQGQPILIGHHSERAARRDQEKAHRAMEKATQAISTQQHWLSKISGVQAYANQKNSPRTRANRIKTLLVDLRKFQRGTNYSYRVVKQWDDIMAIESEEDRHYKIAEAVGTYDPEGSMGYMDARGHIQQLIAFNTGRCEEAPTHSDSQLVTFDSIAERSRQAHFNNTQSERKLRWINHTLGRLSYENSFFSTPYYDGPINAGLLQTFVRTHGADKPKATKTEDGWKIASDAPLPLHIGDGKELELSEDGWRELMQGVSYEIVAKPKAPPILNFKADGFLIQSGYNGTRRIEQIEMTKEEYSGIYKDYRGTRLSSCGQFRVKVTVKGHSSLVAVFLANSKAHPAPESDSVNPPEEKDD